MLLVCSLRKLSQLEDELHMYFPFLCGLNNNTRNMSFLVQVHGTVCKWSWLTVYVFKPLAGNIVLWNKSKLLNMSNKMIMNYAFQSYSRLEILYCICLLYGQIGYKNISSSNMRINIQKLWTLCHQFLFNSWNKETLYIRLVKQSIAIFLPRSTMESLRRRTFGRPVCRSPQALDIAE